MPVHITKQYLIIISEKKTAKNTDNIDSKPPTTTIDKADVFIFSAHTKENNGVLMNEFLRAMYIHSHCCYLTDVLMKVSLTKLPIP